MRRTFKRAFRPEPLEGRTLPASAAAALPAAAAADFAVQRDRFRVDGSHSTFAFADTLAGGRFNHAFTMDVEDVGGAGPSTRARDALAIFLGRLGSFLAAGDAGPAQGLAIVREQFRPRGGGGAEYTLAIRSGRYLITQRYVMSAANVDAGTVFNQALDFAAAEQFATRLSEHADAFLRARDGNTGNSRLGANLDAGAATRNGASGGGAGSSAASTGATSSNNGPNSLANSFATAFGTFGNGTPFGLGGTAGAGSFGSGTFGGTTGATPGPVIVPPVIAPGGTTGTGGTTSPGTNLPGTTPTTGGGILPDPNAATPPGGTTGTGDPGRAL